MDNVTPMNEQIESGEGESLWDDPIPLTTAEVQDWPEDLLPAPLDTFVAAVSASTETPHEIAISDVLAVLGTAVQRKYEIKVKPDYREPLCYWGLSVQPPASRKSRVKSYTMQPLVEYEQEQAADLKDAITQAESERKTELKIIDGLRNKVVKIADLNERKQPISDIAEMEANLTDIPTLPRLWTDDITPERLATLMAENYERMGILSAEGGVFGIMAGRYSNGSPNLNIFLKSHAQAPVGVPHHRYPARQ